MKKKHTAQLRRQVASTRRISVFGAFSLQLVFGSAAVCSLITGTLLAFFHFETPAKASQRMLTFGERVAYQRAIEEVYWRHRIWPRNRGERPDSKPSLDAVMSQAQIEKKVADYLRESQALEDYGQQPITAEQLQAEMDRMAQHTKQPEVLHELFEALGNDPFVIAECLARPILSERLKPAKVEWRKASSDSWRAGAEKLTVVASANYALPVMAVPSGTCTDDTWSPTSVTNAAAARRWHTAVWTGSEMIVWGGYVSSGSNTNTGARYNPSTDSWTATSTTNAPAARNRHTAVWTGSEMIVWGGYVPGTGDSNTGGRYSPATDSWTATNTTNAPDAREVPTAVWTGSEMIVWGGSGNSVRLNTGGRYDPSADSWTATSITNAPAARYGHTAVWTGSEMIVWGGHGDSGYLNTGGRYNLSTDSWTASNIVGAPAGRQNHMGVWTSSEMIVWGGDDFSNYFNTGGTYDPSADSWTATNIIGAPAARDAETAVWTDSEMILWGGYDGNAWLNTGSRYNPSTDSWTATSLTNAPQGRGVHTAVWTGTEMIVWGGTGSSGYLNTGGKYCAQSGAPSPTPTATPCASVGAWTEQASYPIAVSGHAVVSVGGNVYSFGGIVNNAAITTAYKYNPMTNTWTPIAPLPAPRGWFSGASDGTYIYLLGGVDQNFNTTATLWRYDPATNTYNTSLPSYTIPTYFHASAYLNGKIYRIAGAAIGTDFHVEVYDIATNTWSMAATYPFANHNLMAVALGSYIYAGGGNASPTKTYRYDPSIDIWEDAAVADFPAGRSSAASVAYNGRWLLAGGDVNFATSNSVIAWDPATNTWNDLPNMVHARDNLEGATAGQSFYAVAGDFGPGNPSNDNQQYTEVCATSTPTPTPTAAASATPTCPPGNQYVIAQIGGSIVPGTTDIGDDDTVVTIPLPFSYTLYDQTFTSINLSPNGNAQFTTTDTTFINQCLPWLTHNYTIYPYWDDLYLVNSGFSIFASISGSAPNRIFNIEWRAQYFPGIGNANFELRLYEGQTRFDVIYGTVTNGNTSATAGVQKNDTTFTQYFCNGTGGAASGGQSYILTPCGTPTPTPTATPMPCHVTSPTCGSVITGTAPTDFIIDLSDPVDPVTVQPSDFTVNGTPANADMITNGNTTIVFHFTTTPVMLGQNTMHIPACAFNCANGCVQEFTCTFTYQPSTPTPTPTASLPPSPTPTVTATPTATPTLTPRPSPTPRFAPTPRPRPTPPPRP